MFKLNKKGQASSTFQLLIAAIVALAILGVLIAVIGKIDPGGSDVKTTTNQLLQQQVNNPGARQCTTPIKFKRNTTLAAQGVTNNTGLDETQLTFSTEVDTIPSFNIIGDGKILSYDGSADKTISLCIICSNDGSAGLESVLSDYSLDISLPSYLSESGETACVIYTKKSA